ncbi:MAG: hypothetical protein K2O05_02355 [Anaeroplasmataceae bacterium]|nr:hypothetical protein [Anaeroplasmataceae bacterium]
MKAFFDKVLFYLFGRDQKINRLVQRYIKRRSSFKKIKLLKRSIVIGKNSKIGTNLKLIHAMNIVIGEYAEIGNNCTIYQNVTIGQKDYKFPKIGNDCIIYPNAILIGDIQIGNNVIVGAGAVVTKSFPDNCIIGGNPAKIIKQR